MIKRMITLVFIITVIFLSCYDGVQDAYEEGRGYKLGDRGPAGGWIFYLNPNYKADGWRYLEAVPEDQSDAEYWINWGSSPNPQATLNGKTSVGIGSGKSNTEAIIAQAGHTNSVAVKCRNYRGGGYDDWFLPSYDELDQMRINLHLSGVVPFAADTYWSSSEYDSDEVYTIYFSTVPLVLRLKTSTANMARAVRRF